MRSRCRPTSPKHRTRAQGNAGGVRLVLPALSRSKGVPPPHTPIWSRSVPQQPPATSRSGRFVAAAVPQPQTRATSWNDGI